MGAKKTEEWCPTQFLIDPEIHRQLRIAAIEQGISMAEALRETVILWLKTKQDKEEASKEEG